MEKRICCIAVTRNTDVDENRHRVSDRHSSVAVGRQTSRQEMTKIAEHVTTDVKRPAAVV